MESIPLVDLKAQYLSIKNEIDEAISKTIENSSFIMGESVKKFEREFAAFCKVPHAIAASSGTTALHLALIGCGVGQGDEVILPTHTFIATAEAICHCGATPVFVDVEPDTYNIDPEGTRAAITSKTKVILPVHLYGQCAEMDPILEMAEERGIKVVEDSAQAHGAEYKGSSAGAMGNFGCYSFFPGKNLGAYGDAGMAVTKNDSDAERLHLLVNHGRSLKYEHHLIGFNYRMDALQAAILSVKLRHLDRWTDARRRLARRYNELLKGLPLETPVERHKHVYHLYVIQCEKRDSLGEALKKEGIATGIHYPIPLHLQPCFKDLPNCIQGAFPVTEKLASRILSLPLYPEMTDEQQDKVAASIRRFFRH
jgi:dTDP-4-amino-4,6-dideoxygalactose transaminase